jgi:hypothetical protein
LISLMFIVHVSLKALDLSLRMVLPYIIQPCARNACFMT